MSWLTQFVDQAARSHLIPFAFKSAHGGTIIVLIAHWGWNVTLSQIRAIFEPGVWQDFSKEHRTLREELQASLDAYRAGKFRDPMAVWGAFGAGKTQFLFWVAEKALVAGLIPRLFSSERPSG